MKVKECDERPSYTLQLLLRRRGPRRLSGCLASYMTAVLLGRYGQFAFTTPFGAAARYIIANQRANQRTLSLNAHKRALSDTRSLHGPHRPRWHRHACSNAFSLSFGCCGVEATATSDSFNPPLPPSVSLHWFFSGVQPDCRARSVNVHVSVLIISHIRTSQARCCASGQLPVSSFAQILISSEQGREGESFWKVKRRREREHLELRLAIALRQGIWRLDAERLG